MAEWVWMYHPDQGERPDRSEFSDEDVNTIAAQVTRESYDLAWRKRGWKLIDEVVAEDIPGTANEIYSWLDDAPDADTRLTRAKAVLAAENKSDSPRKTVVSRAEAVVNTPTAHTSPEDTTTSNTTPGAEA